MFILDRESGSNIIKLSEGDPGVNRRLELLCYDDEIDFEEVCILPFFFRQSLDPFLLLFSSICRTLYLIYFLSFSIFRQFVFKICFPTYTYNLPQNATEWFKDGERLTSQRDRYFFSDNRIVIPALTRTDEGKSLIFLY